MGYFEFSYLATIRNVQRQIIAAFYTPFNIIFLVVAPEILSDIVDSTDEGRDLATFTCQATGEPAPTIRWHFNDVMINVSDTSKYMIMSTPINTTTTENTLTVYNVTSSDVGTYTCNATSTIGSDISHGKVEHNNNNDDLKMVIVLFHFRLSDWYGLSVV